MTYQDALQYLAGLRRFGIKPGLDRTVELLRRVGRPDRRSGKVVHITGTSGKGSVAAMVGAALCAAGFRVGLFTSPSLEHFTDRIQVDRQNITEAEFVALVAEARLHASAMVAEGLEQPTEFEVITVVAFMYYARRQVDWLVLEVGFGGRLDSTNVIEAPVLTCLTNVGLDHMEWLGSTHAEIAWDKAGIIKPATPCVTGTDHPEALGVIREVALSQDAVLIEVSPADAQVVSFGHAGQVADLLGARGWYRGVRLSLLGRHQAVNAAVAVRVLELAGLGEAAIRAGLGTVVWAARFEILKVRGRTVLLDAAHNEAKCSALATAIGEYFPGRRVHLVLGVLADKQVQAMVPPLAVLAERIWTVTPDSPRALSAAVLGEVCAAAGHHDVRIGGPVAGTVTTALAATDPTGLLVVTGSFYTVGPARGVLIGQE